MTAVLSGEGPLSRSDPSSGQSESWPDRGAPERPMVAEGGAPGGAAPLPKGARGLKGAARGGFVNPASRDASPASWRLPPLHRPRNDARVTGKPRTHRAARIWKLGCLTLRVGSQGRDAATYSASCAGLTRASIIFARLFRREDGLPGQAHYCPVQKIPSPYKCL